MGIKFENKQDINGIQLSENDMALKKDLDETNSQLEQIANNGASKKTFGMRSKLIKKTEPVIVSLQGDSTGNGYDEWFYKTMKEVAKHNLAYTFLYRLWNDSKQAYDDAEYIQFGENGHGYANLSGGYLYVNDVAAMRLTGDIEVIAKVSANDYTIATSQTIVSKFGNAGNRGWALMISPAGKPYFWWSVDGTTLSGGATSGIESESALPVTDGQQLWLKAFLDVDNGAGGTTAKYYTSTNGETWEQFGQDRTISGTTSVYASTEEFDVGARTQGADVFFGKIYYLSVRNGATNTLIFAIDFGMAFPSVISTVTELTGKILRKYGNSTFGNGSPTVVLLNASCPGKDVSYSSDVTRFPLQVPVKPDVSFINYSHNATTSVSYYTDYEALIDKITASYPRAGIVCMSQNPEKSPMTNILQHAVRCSQIAEISEYKRCDYIDVYGAFVLTQNPDSYIGADGVHPNTIGQTLWTNTVIGYLSPVSF